MKITTLICAFFALLITFTASAQDKIIKRNGDIFTARVSLIDQDKVVFKMADNPTGPDYTLPKSEISRILYDNGSEDIFDDVTTGTKAGSKNLVDINRNKNIYGFSPIVLTEHGYGLGFNWEHSIDKGGWITFNIPAILTWNFSDAGVQKDALVYLTPTLKFYPGIYLPGKTKYSIGPALVFAAGKGVPSNNVLLQTDPAAHQNQFLMGAMAIAGANVFPSPHIYMGLDFGMGYSYINQFNGLNDATRFLVQLSLKCGYRYDKKSTIK